MTTILAATTEKFPGWLTSPTQWPGQGDLLSGCQDMGPATACILVMGGIIYLLWGVQIFKWLITANAAVLGAAIGAFVGERTDTTIAGALVGAFAAGAIAWPLMKYAVAVMGGIVGAALGASVWKTAGLEPAFAWAGALTGLVVLGMLSFILFRSSIIMYLSMQGSVMLVFGVLGLGYKYKDVASSLTSSLKSKPMMLPMAILIPMLCGFIYQQTRFGIASDGGGGGGGGGSGGGGGAKK